MNTNSAEATIVILDRFTNILFRPVASRNAPVGIDYHAPTNSLIVSYNYSEFAGGGQPYNFARIYTNMISTNIVTVVTNWSGVSNVLDEVKLATVFTGGALTNAAGFTNGDMFFSSSTGIGWVSADGTRSNLNWCILTNAVEQNALPLRGGLYVDRTGVFSNQLIAVTSPGGGVAGNKGVWRVNANGAPTLITNINTPHLEGVITLTNDVTKWGPWAGKIITGDEDASPSPVIYTIDANGIVTTNNTTTLIAGGIYPKDFDIIPPNQDLYACDPGANTIVKLAASYLTNYVGDLIITDAGEGPFPPAKLFILHWNAATTNFEVRRIRYYRADGSIGSFEHVSFAPIDLPPAN